MNRDRLEYEPPKTKIYRFDSSDRILTESGQPTGEYAAAALNGLFGGDIDSEITADLTTTIEID
ncbi:MAG: hypothetical protein ACI4RV_09820 [Eubacteriales bacterium]